MLCESFIRFGQNFDFICHSLMFVFQMLNGADECATYFFQVVLQIL